MGTTPLTALREAMQQLRADDIDIATFCRLWRAQTAVHQSLPARYEQVAEDLLGRLETGRLFTEESCSFSQADLLEHLSIWLDKAEKYLST